MKFDINFSSTASVKKIRKIAFKSVHSSKDNKQESSRQLLDGSDIIRNYGLASIKLSESLNFKQIESSAEIDKSSLNEFQSAFLDFISQYETLMKNEEFLVNLAEIIESIVSEESLEAKKNFIKQLMTNENLRKIMSGKITTFGLIGKIQNDWQMEAKLEILNNISLIDVKHFESQEVLDFLNSVIKRSDNPTEAKNNGLLLKSLFDEKLGFDFDKIKNIYEEAWKKNKCDLTAVLLSEISGNTEFLKTDLFQNMFSILVKYTDNIEQAKARSVFISTFINSDYLQNNESVKTKLLNLILTINSQEKAEAIKMVLDKISANEVLLNDKSLNKDLSTILRMIDSKEQVEGIFLFFDKVFSDKKMSENPLILSNIKTLFINFGNKKQAVSCINVLDKIYSNDVLANNKDINEHIIDIIQSSTFDAYSEGKIAFLDFLLNNEKLIENEDLMGDVGKILSTVFSVDLFNIKKELLLKLIKIQEECGFSDLSSNLFELVFKDCSREDIYARIKTIDSVLKDIELTKVFSNGILMKNFISSVWSYNQDYAQKLINEYNNSEIIPAIIPGMVAYRSEWGRKAIEKIYKTLGREDYSKIPSGELMLVYKILPLYKKNSVNQIPLAKKREVLKSIINANTELFGKSEFLKELFPLLPVKQEEYCLFLPSLVRSIGIATNELLEDKIIDFENSIIEFANVLKNKTDEEFVNLKIEQEYSTDEFIKDVLEIINKLSKEEQQKVFDYFGFELRKNSKTITGYSIVGYPVNLNNGKKMSEIESFLTRASVEQLRKKVIKFTDDNKIILNDKELELLINKIMKALPELRTTINKKQHKTHDFDIFKHSLKVMQKIVQNTEFERLNASDKKLMLLTALLHDIAKKESYVDKLHPSESAFDAFYIAKKFGLTRQEEIKLYYLIKNHNWFEFVNTSEDVPEIKERLQSVAFDLQQGNLFEMEKILTKADLKSVKIDDTFYTSDKSKNRMCFDGKKRSFKETLEIYSGYVQKYITELKTTQPFLPVTKIPKASEINKRIKLVNQDGSTNLKGVYKDKNGLIILKYNEIDDWESIGFPKGSISKGIEQIGYKDEKINTGNIKFFVHGLDYETQVRNFDVFALPDSDALLSLSYAERPESKYRFFRPQGVILDFENEYIYGGGKTDYGSGVKKSLDIFKSEYVFGGINQENRVFVSELIKEALGFNDDEYLEFVELNKNKQFSEIEPIEIREKVIKALATINSHKRRGDRAYNEMYGTNPTRVMAVFAYEMQIEKEIGNPFEFLNRNAKRTGFLKKYALEHDIPFVLFGN